METKDFREIINPLVDWCENDNEHRSVIVLTVEKSDVKGESDNDDSNNRTCKSLQAAVLGSGECLLDSIVEAMGQNNKVAELFKKGVLVATLKNIIKK